MRVQHLTDRGSLDALRSDWNRLAGDNPFRSWNWLVSWWDAFCPGSLCVLVCRDDADNIEGIAPFFVAKHAALGSVLRLMGTGKACSEYLGILAEPINANEVAGAVADSLVDMKSGSHCNWDMVELESTLPHDSGVSQLTNHLEVHGGCVQTQDAMPCWVIDLPPTWDEYLSSLEKKRRQKTRGVLKNIEDVAQATVASIEELDEWFESFVNLHIRRRSSLQADHCFEFTGFDDFLINAARKMVDSGELQLRHTWINGQLAASSFNLIKGSTCYVYQPGMNPDLSQASPGWLMNVLNIQQCIRDGITTYDLLRGDERYKAHLMAKPQETVDVRISAPGKFSKVKCQIWQTTNKLIDWGQTMAPFTN